MSRTAGRDPRLRYGPYHQGPRIRVPPRQVGDVAVLDPPRDGAGSRLQPKADYRYTDAATGVEHTEEPPDWSDELMDCPDCSGAGEFEVTEGQVSLFDGLPALTRPCSNCKDEETPGQVQRWTRANLWRGHDYFYDAFAIREPIAPASVARLSQASFWTQHGGPKDYGTSGVYPNRSGRKALENLARKSWHGDFAPRAGDGRGTGGIAEARVPREMKQTNR